MIGALEALCTLTGDVLVAIGSALRERRTGFSEYEAGDFLTAEALTCHVSGFRHESEAESADLVGSVGDDRPDHPSVWLYAIAQYARPHAPAWLTSAVLDLAGQFEADELDDTTDHAARAAADFFPQHRGK